MNETFYIPKSLKQLLTEGRVEVINVSSHSCIQYMSEIILDLQSNTYGELKTFDYLKGDWKVIVPNQASCILIIREKMKETHTDRR